MKDYQGNSRKGKEQAGGESTSKPEKKVQKVVAGEVVIKKKGIGQKIKDIFIHADPRSVATFVVASVLIPAARNMLYDAGSEAWKRMLFGDSAPRNYNQGITTKISYNYPVNRHPREPRTAPPIEVGPRRAARGPGTMTILVETREEAELVLESLQDIVSQYDVASVADLNDLIGAEPNHVDNKWGWVFLHESKIYQVRDGFNLELPAPEPIQ